MLRNGVNTAQMMKVVGEEGTNMDDFLSYLKGELIDNGYLQQNSFHDVAAAAGAARQRVVFAMLEKFTHAKFNFAQKEDARRYFLRVTQGFADWHLLPEGSAEFARQEEHLLQLHNQGLQLA